MGHFSPDAPLALRLSTAVDAQQREVRAGVRLMRDDVHSIGQTAPGSALR